jgi:hypothetical protein
MRPQEPNAANAWCTAIGHMHYTFYDESATKWRRFFSGKVMFCGVPFQCVGHFLSVLRPKTKCSEKRCLVTPIFVYFAEKVIDNFRATNDRNLTIGHFHCGMRSSRLMLIL